MASSRSIGNVYAELSVKDKMTVGLKQAGKTVDMLGGKAAKLAAAFGIGISGAGLATALTAGAKRALDLGGSLSDVSAATGIAISDAMKLQAAYKAGGIEADRLGADIAKMQKNIAGAAGGGNDPFQALGLSAQRLMMLSPADQFNEIGKALTKIENPTRRNAAAMEIFGKSGAKLFAVFGQVDEAAISLGRMPEVAERFAASFDKAGDIIDALPNKSDQFFVGFTSGIIGELLPALDEINKKDFTTLGENLGDSISSALEGLRDGTIWEIWALKGSKAIAELGNKLSTMLPGGVNDQTGFSDWLTNFIGTDEVKKSWEDIKKREASNPVGVFDSFIKDTEDAINVLTKEMERRSNKRKDAAAALQTPPPNPANDVQSYIAGLTPDQLGIPILSDLLGNLPFDFGMPQKRDTSWQQTQYEVNDMQRRGLGMGGETVVKEANKQTEYLKGIHEVLANAKLQDKELVWN